jgi:hypothetical protein
MQHMLDNTTASIIAAALFLMLVTVNIRTNAMLTETTGYYALVQQTQNVSQLLRRDMQGVVSPSTVSSDTESAFEFTGLLGTDPTPKTFRYVAEAAGTIESLDADGQATTETVYRIKRLVDGAEAGGTPDVITDWSMQCLDQGGDVVTAATLDACSQIRVAFEVVPRRGGATTVTHMNWESTFYPPLIQ